jgi:serine/threonine protein kinase/regulator of sirC expression with transglutaminase-like and TPR domain
VITQKTTKIILETLAHNIAIFTSYITKHQKQISIKEGFMLKPGDNLGPYQLIARIGNGAFGDVWRAKKREGISPEVAIKVLHDNSNNEAFQKEALIWVNLGFHPNVMQIIDANVYDDYSVIVSPYTSEGSLEDWLPKNAHPVPPFSEKIAVELIIGILQGLAHLHKNKIIHSDLAPKNILLQNGIPRLIDFGQSRIFTASQNTVDGHSGTPAYMAPEVYSNGLSPRSDIWSVGVIFYRLLCGKLPFEAQRNEAIMKKVLFDPPPPLPITISNPVQNIVFQALEKERENRFSNPEAMIEALRVQALPLLINPSIEFLNSAPLELSVKPPQLPVNQAFEATKNSVAATATSSTTSISNSTNSTTMTTSLPIAASLHTPSPSFDIPPTITTLPSPSSWAKSALFKYLMLLTMVMLIPLSYVVYQYLLPLTSLHNSNSLTTNPITTAAKTNTNTISAPSPPTAKSVLKADNSPNPLITVSLPPLKNAKAYFSRALKYQDQHQLDLALSDYTNVIKLNPKYADAYNNRGNVYKDQGLLDLALVDYNQAIYLNPKDANAYNGRGNVYYDQGKLDLALIDYNKSIHFNPKYAEAYNNRGNVYSNQGQLDLALADYQKALLFDPKNAQAYYNRGLVHQKRNQLAEAIADFQQAKSFYKNPEKIAQCTHQLRSLGVSD